MLKRQSKAYLKVARRQLAMAESLLEKEFYEGVMFHSYHALESALAAGIAQKLHPVPRPHKQKINTFITLYQDIPIIDEIKLISRLLYPHRDKSLYADVEFGELSDPSTIYSREDALDAINKVNGVVEKVEEILNKGEQK